MTTLVITRGLPGSGKTTFARPWVEEDRAHRARVNRDDIRQMVDEGFYGKGTEARILAIRNSAIAGLLRQGVDVICDDTNLPQRVARDLAGIARRARADFEVIDLTNVPLEECLVRNSARNDKAPVPEAAIRDMHKRFIKGKEYPLPLPEEPAETTADLVPYVPVPGTPKAVLVDIDGTTALMGARSAFDETRVHEDKPNIFTIIMIRALHAAGYFIIFMSGRTDGCYAATYAWLVEHVGIGDAFGLIMRPKGDGRKDSIVKLELFNKHVRDFYNIVGALDDRDQCVALWRALGLPCNQVSEGNF